MIGKKEQQQLPGPRPKGPMFSQALSWSFGSSRSKRKQNKKMATSSAGAENKPAAEEAFDRNQQSQKRVKIQSPAAGNERVGRQKEKKKKKKQSNEKEKRSKSLDSLKSARSTPTASRTRSMESLNRMVENYKLCVSLVELSSVSAHKNSDGLPLSSHQQYQYHNSQPRKTSSRSAKFIHFFLIKNYNSDFVLSDYCQI